MIKQTFLLIFCFSLALGCNPSSGDSKKEEPKKKTDSIVSTSAKKDSVVTQHGINAANLNPDNRFNNITAVLCGEKGKAGNLNYLFDTIAWAQHAKFIDSSWKRLEKKRLVAMQKWGRKEFEKANDETKMVFYPFSG
ncbi:MAG: hypothetical protein ACXVC7_11595, partial [Bacteroidia bacterium]